MATQKKAKLAHDKKKAGGSAAGPGRFAANTVGPRVDDAPDGPAVVVELQDGAKLLVDPMFVTAGPDGEPTGLAIALPHTYDVVRRANAEKRYLEWATTRA